MNKLQVTQNTALRITTGCTQTTPIHHLHRETQVLPLEQHMLMRETRIYPSTDCPTHPLHHLRSAPARRQRARPPRTTVAKLYQQELDSLPPTPDNTSLRTHIRTVYTNRTLDTYPVNTILGTSPPHINTQAETHLPREDRVHLSRLRCGHHTAIPAYMYRIRQAPNPDCPHCNSAEGTIQHLILHCPALQVHRDLHHIHALEHLWERPEETGIPQGRLHNLEAKHHAHTGDAGRGECCRGRRGRPLSCRDSVWRQPGLNYYYYPTQLPTPTKPPQLSLQHVYPRGPQCR